MEFSPLIEKTLNDLISEDLHPDLFKAARYSLEGGKFLRPNLTLSVVASFNGSIERALRPACALELIHTYSLIHDDLPCMDDDDMRRGRPSLHKAFPEAHAVLTGDFFLTYAFEVIALAPGLSAEEINQLILTLAKRSGAQGMLGGQFMDIADAIESEALFEMHLKKTAALFSCAFEFGGILSEHEIPLLTKIGQHLGLAYQLWDDISDVDQDQQNAVSFFGLDKTRERAAIHYEEALKGIKDLNCPNDTLESALKSLFSYSN